MFGNGSTSRGSFPFIEKNYAVMQSYRSPIIQIIQPHRYPTREAKPGRLCTRPPIPLPLSHFQHNQKLHSHLFPTLPPFPLKSSLSQKKKENSSVFPRLWISSNNAGFTNHLYYTWCWLLLLGGSLGCSRSWC